MFDLKAIRTNPQEFDQNWARRGISPQTPTILSLDEQHRKIQTELQELLARRNEKSKEIGKVKSQGGDAQAIMDEVSGLKQRIAGLEEHERALYGTLHQHLSAIPNTLAADVPDGPDETHNVEIRKHGEPKSLNSKPKDHVDIGEGLGMMDFESAAKISGSRFVFLSDGLARMERALAQFMLDTHVEEHGLTEVNPPLLVRDAALFGTGQLPKFADDQFKMVENEQVFLDGEEVIVQDVGEVQGKPSYRVTPKDPEARDIAEILEAADEVQVMSGRSGPKRVIVRNRRWAIATSEISLTNIVADSIVEEETLPRRMAAYTPCFRQEAGSAGKDTRGMIRMHQFYKVEMVTICTPETSPAEHERMVGCAETILKKLELPFRTIVLCSGDTGFCAQKTYDIEVWVPSQNTYREISSCSNCADFQARRMNARCRAKGEKETRFVHTLNGSGLAVGRALVAVIENYFDPADGGVHVPKVLQPYMGGLTKLMPKAA